MNYKRESLPNFRYSLHDASLINIEVQGQDLILKTDYGFVNIEKNQQVDGDIILQEISLEDSYVHLMEFKKVLCGNPGNFSGEKIQMSDFLEKYKKDHIKIDIMGEYCGFRTLFIRGYLSLKDEIYEIHMELYYEGDFIYQIKDK